MLPFRAEYILRLDEQPGAERLMRTDLTRLLKLYQWRKAKGTLPPQWSPPPPPKPAAKPEILIGHRESPADIVERTRAVHPQD